MNGSTVTHRRTMRADRFAARRTLWRETSLDRVRACGHHGVMEGGSVAVKASGTVAGGDRVAGLSGVATCGSVWACPVCSAKIANRRADELAQLLSAWRRSSGDPLLERQIAMVTLTMRHRRGQSLRSLWDALSRSWARVTSGRGWGDDQALYGCDAYADGRVRVPWLRAVEVTYGKRGWHVHIHALFLLDHTATDESVATFGGRLFGRWAAGLSAQGYSAVKDKGGFHARRLHMTGTSNNVADYLHKATYEVVGGQNKKARGQNRTPFQVLADLVTNGEADDLDTWREWERGSHGRRQITWSRGLREAMRLDDEQTDQEIAEEDAGGDVLVVIDAAGWTWVRAYAAALLDAAEDDDDGAGLHRFLAGVGVALPA